jgi:hypothetical protein
VKRGVNVLPLGGLRRNAVTNTASKISKAGVPNLDGPMLLRALELEAFSPNARTKREMALAAATRL